MRFRRSLAAAAAVSLVSTGTLALWPAAVSATNTNLVTNGSFEQPAIASGTVALSNSVPGWTRDPSSLGSGIEIQNHVGVDLPPPGGGNQFVELDSDGSTTIYQDVPTSIGTSYVLEFAYSARPFTAAADNQFRVSFGTASQLVGPLTPGTSVDWQPSSPLFFTATATTTRVQFADLGPSNGVGALIDLVSVRDPSLCTRTVTGDTAGPVTSGSQETVCIQNARVSGGVTVNVSGGLIVTDSKVAGGINAVGKAVFVQVCGSQVVAATGLPDQAIAVFNALGKPFTVGNPGSGCAANTIAGGVNLSFSSGLTFAGNTLSRGAEISANVGPVVISGNNFLTGTLDCVGNSPAPTNGGVPNTAPGGKAGQCAAL